ncbi:MAG TPA: hypothetical protein PKE64_16525 [Anaerolineae bacterium]|nr:hypothetical protein [Anaerolineae bacterium]HMR65615.1 hypothetical protein [Anaerolineae bacterium]
MQHLDGLGVIATGRVGEEANRLADTLLNGLFRAKALIDQKISVAPPQVRVAVAIRAGLHPGLNDFFISMLTR